MGRYKCFFWYSIGIIGTKRRFRAHLNPFQTTPYRKKNTADLEWPAACEEQELRSVC